MQHAAYKRNLYVQCKEYLRSFRRDPAQFFMNKKTRFCTCCGYKGAFISMRKNRREARCPNCASRERDRQFFYYLSKHNLSLEGMRILHFSPEPYLFKKLSHHKDYISGDIKKSKYARYHVDITDIDYPDSSFDYIICNHVLEHVIEDAKGLRECLRVLKDNGIAFFSVPIDMEKTETFEPPPTMPKEEVERICGWDHKRIYGRDFTDRIKKAGFIVEEFIPTAEELEEYGLENQPIFIARKSPAASGAN